MLLFRKKKTKEKENSEKSFTLHFDSQVKVVQIRLFPKNENTQIWGKSNIPDPIGWTQETFLGSNPSSTAYWLLALGGSLHLSVLQFPYLYRTI